MKIKNYLMMLSACCMVMSIGATPRDEMVGEKIDEKDAAVKQICRDKEEARDDARNAAKAAQDTRGGVETVWTPRASDEKISSLDAAAKKTNDEYQACYAKASANANQILNKKVAMNTPGGAQQIMAQHKQQQSAK